MNAKNSSVGKNKILHNYLNISSFGSPFRGHNIRISYPIIELKESKAFDWDLINWRFQNSKVYQKNITFQFKVSIQKFNEKVILNFAPVNKEQEFFDSQLFLMVKKAERVAYYFLKRHGVLIDDLQGRVISSEVAQEKEDFRGKVERNSTGNIFLNEDAVSVDSCEQEAWVKLDFSNRKLEWESNSLTQADKLALLPEFVWQMREISKEFAPSLKKYNENIELHLSVLTKMKEILEKLNSFLDFFANLKKKLFFWRQR